MKRLILISALIAVSGIASAQITKTASQTYYVSTTGSGTTSTSFRVESYGGGASYAQFGLADFNFGTVTNFDTLTAKVTVSNDGVQYYMTAPGYLDVYISTYTGSNTGLRYQNITTSDNTTTNNIDPTLNPGGTGLFLLGSLRVSSTASGTVSTGTYTVSSTLATYLKSELAAGGNVRLVVAVDEAAITPTKDQEFYLAGWKSTTYTPPTLTLTPAAVPEPAPLAILGLGALGLLIRRRR